MTGALQHKQSHHARYSKGSKVMIFHSEDKHLLPRISKVPLQKSLLQFKGGMVA